MGKGLGKILGAAAVLAAALALWWAAQSGALARALGEAFPAAPSLRGAGGADLDGKGSPAASGSPVAAALPGEACALARIVDGDTVRVRCAGSPEEPVRLVGVDAPEVARQGKPAECGAAGATEALARALGGGPVFLSPDPRQPDRDRYGRLLRFLATSSSPVDPDAPWEGSVNLGLVREGGARAYRDLRYGGREAFYVAEDSARAEGAGLWEACPNP